MNKLQYKHITILSTGNILYPVTIFSEKSGFRQNVCIDFDVFKEELEDMGEAIILSESKWLADNTLEWWNEEYYG